MMKKPIEKDDYNIIDEPGTQTAGDNGLLENNDGDKLISQITTAGIATVPTVQNDTVADIHANPSETGNVVSIENINNIPVTLSAVLGKRKIDMASLLTLERGSILDIDKKIGDPIDLYINDHLVARGELIMVDGGLGVSMTEIVQTKTPSITTQNING